MTAPAPDLIPATPLHAAVLAAVHETAFAYPWSADDFATLLADPSVFGRIATDGGSPCGMVLFRTVLDEAEVLTVGIPPERRRQGLAARLMTEAMTVAATRGAEKVFLEVADSNAAAQALYLRLAFTVAGRRKQYYRTPDGTLEDALVMVRSLS